MHYWYFSYCRMVFFCILGECLSLHQISCAISAEVRALQINMPAQNILSKEFSTLETTPLVVDQILFIFLFLRHPASLISSSGLFLKKRGTQCPVFYLKLIFLPGRTKIHKCTRDFYEVFF